MKESKLEQANELGQIMLNSNKKGLLAVSLHPTLFRAENVAISPMFNFLDCLFYVEKIFLSNTGTLFYTVNLPFQTK